jgi:hypothetical protein
MSAYSFSRSFQRHAAGRRGGLRRSLASRCCVFPIFPLEWSSATSLSAALSMSRAHLRSCANSSITGTRRRERAARDRRSWARRSRRDRCLASRFDAGRRDGRRAAGCRRSGARARAEAGPAHSEPRALWQAPTTTTVRSHWSTRGSRSPSTGSVERSRRLGCRRSSSTRAGLRWAEMPGARFASSTTPRGFARVRASIYGVRRSGGAISVRAPVGSPATRCARFGAESASPAVAPSSSAATATCAGGGVRLFAHSTTSTRTSTCLVWWSRSTSPGAWSARPTPAARSRRTTYSAE